MTRTIRSGIYALPRNVFVTCIAALIFTVSSIAQGTTKAPVDTRLRPVEVAFDFNYVHSNAPVAGCGCFPLFGGSVSGAYFYDPHFALVAEFSKLNNDNVDNTGHELTITTYLFGGKYLYPIGKSRFAPYMQIMLGVSNDSGMIAQTNPGGPSGYSVFAADFGGGVDYRIKPKLTLRLAKMDYYLTTFPNRADNHQNNLRVTSGIALRF